ncbi:hypothetical protein M3699_02880 [Peribacillus simplex]|uniref:hypothetical protein n=1 Tax=Peribacillus simplex TaxID=1478 RepID=UPI00203EFEC2|nr:hypothetical protein [Peribacillus simplex]MCM3672841.1 hypothetical protein [Peribacillus simplex]
MKMNGKIFYKVSLIGLINGILLGVIMKWVEMFSGKQVYKLLLNVDFLPVIGDVSWSEASLFFFSFSHWQLRLVTFLFFIL